MSVFRRTEKNGKQSEFYSYDFVRGGRRFSGTTEFTTKREAKRYVDKLKADASKPQQYDSINDAFGAYWDEKAKHSSDANTIFWRMELLQDNISVILKAERLPADVGQIRTRHLTRYVELRRKQPNRRKELPAPGTINREMQLLRTIMRRVLNVWECDIRLPDFGSALLDEPDAIVREIPPLVLDEIKSVLRDDYHDALDFLVLAGNRAGNIMSRNSKVLAPDDVDLENRELTFFVKSRKPGGRRIVVPITTPMLVILSRNLGMHDDAVFTYVARASRNGRIRGQRYPIALSSFYSAFKRAASEIGHPEIRVHDLRHTALTRTYRATGDLVLARDQAGHTRISTTQRYTHANTDALRAAMEKAHYSHETPTNDEPAGFKALIKRKKQK